MCFKRSKFFCGEQVIRFYRLKYIGNTDKTTTYYRYELFILAINANKTSYLR